LISVLKITF